jgi:hypothetical protein
MRGGVVFPGDPRHERRTAKFGYSRGVDQHLAVLFGLGQHWIPDISRIDVATCEGGGDLRRLQVQNIHLCRVDARVVQRKQQAIMGGRDEWRRDFLAYEILDVADAGAVAYDKSALPMRAATRKASIGAPRVTPAASGLEPA